MVSLNHTKRNEVKQLDKNIKRFPLRLEENIHREIKVAAFNKDVSIHQYIMDAVKDKLKKDRTLKIK